MINLKNLFKKRLAPNNEVIATGSGTDSLHLAYLLAGIKENDEVITTVFTCTATNLPLLYLKAKPIFADIDLNTMNLNPDDIKHRITEKTKAIVTVDYAGIPSDYEALSKIAKEYNLKLISDAAQSLGTIYKGQSITDFADFTAFSFQAIKTISTGDGGMLTFKNKKLLNKAKRLRWFGIDRESKQKGVWENDILEIGYKYQMTDISASLGIAALENLDNLISHRRKLLDIYKSKINNAKVRVITPYDIDNTYASPWLCTIIVNEGRFELMNYLRENGIESAQVHYRNDRYAVFGDRQTDLPNMDFLESKYLVLPLHHKVSENNAFKICEIINNF